MLHFIFVRAFTLFALLGLCYAAPLATITIPASVQPTTTSTTAVASTSTVIINTANIATNGTLASNGTQSVTLLNSTVLAPSKFQEKLATTTVYRPAVSFFSGFNVGAYESSGACKTLADWETELRKIKAWNNGAYTWTVVKIFTTSQCNALALAIEAAKTCGGIYIWAGIWADPPAIYTADKAAIETQILAGNSAYIKGISVGSEEMLRGMSAATLSGYIWDVKGMVQNAYLETSIPVGTSDGIAALLNSANQAVLDAVDVAMFTDYPYYGGSNYRTAVSGFKNDYASLVAKMDGRPVIVGETGWPTTGATIGGAYASVSHAHMYFCKLAGWLKSTSKPFFWFESTDEAWKVATGTAAEGKFGVSTTSLKYSLDSC